ncbi:sugar kinase [Alicyclobacillus cycloheptanicus]|uniref:2-dehydro-3-deoxygluconokinase n=1 Tax=Alicyclobacillus cycloheptanicus TaxID=1457 RepID=A0ABT9XEV1_9BACL|nr:sugar kinase [Alicyclobacillus cycloheptanicus]MDQ0188829.1 2-dehydro-3-deoxygluconokinase [Alicyclobacillus cycloheptanicus]WDM00524.1 sugar kinase [Alicyclobacillus cycloheptanicus]
MTTTRDLQRTPSVFTFGEPLVVLVPDAPGLLATTHQLRPYPAGAELNTAVGLARLGLNVAMGCSVGADAFGQLILKSGRAEGVNMAYVRQDEAAPTGVFFKQWSGLKGKTTVYYYRSTSSMAMGGWQPSEELLRALQARTWDWVHSTGITWMIGERTRRVATELLERCHMLELPVSFDVNVRLKLGDVEQWRACVWEVLPYLTWFLLGDEEAALLFDTDDAARIEQVLRDRGFSGEGVVLKLGEAGAVASVQGAQTRTPAWPVSRVVDTVGAGDGFNAGWIAGMLRGFDLNEALKLGAVVGAYAVTSMADYDGYPTWPEALQELTGKGFVER